MQATKAIFHVGDEWVYFKIYLSPLIADKVLIESLYPLSIKLLEERTIRQWFFIRYLDPDYHLRFRLNVTSISKIGIVINKVHNKLSNLLDDRSIWDLSINKYTRELNRYGFKTINLCEKLFSYESILISSIILKNIDNQEFKNKKWLYGMRLIDNLYEIFDYNLVSKLMITKRLKMNFKSEFDLNKSINKMINITYRNHKNEINNFMIDHSNRDLNLNILKFNKDVELICHKITSVLGNEKLDELIPSLTHMCLNRLLLIKQREQEMIIYDFLERHYRTQIALNNSSR